MLTCLRRGGAIGVLAAATTLGCVTGGGGPGGGGLGGGSERGTFGTEGARYINPGTMASLDGFTHAIRVGYTVYVSGEVPLDSTGRLVGPGDLRAQARRVFSNLAFVLDLAGALPSDVSRLNVYVVNYRPADFAVIKEAGADFFPQRNPPAGLVMGVQALPQEGMLIAVDAIANPRGTIAPKVRNQRP